MEKLLVVFAFGSFFLLPMAMGIFALREINRSAGPMKGRWLAIAAIVIGMAGIAISVPVTLLSWNTKANAVIRYDGPSVLTPTNAGPLTLNDLVRQHSNHLINSEYSLSQSELLTAEQFLNQAMVVRLSNDQIPADLQATLKAQEDRVSAKLAKKRGEPAPAETTAMAEKQLQDVLATAKGALDRSDLDAAQKYVDVGKSLKPNSTELKKLADLIAERRKKLELARVTQEAEIHARRMLDEARKRDLEERAKAENVERTQPVSPPQPVAVPTPPKVAPTSTKASSVGEQDPFSE